MTQPLKDIPTLSLLASLRSACIAHEDAASDAVKFNKKMKQLINALMARVEGGDLEYDHEAELQRLRDELDRLKRENTALILKSVPDKHQQPNKTYDEDALIEAMHTLRSMGMCWKGVADAMNERGYRTKRGKLFTYEYANMIYKKSEGNS